MAGKASPRDLSRAKPKGYLKEQPCQPEENLILPDSFTKIYNIIQIGFTTISNEH